MVFKESNENLNIESSESEDEDAIYANELLQGNIQGFEKLYRKYSLRIYSFFCRKAKNLEIASDMTQITWEKVYRNIRQFDDQYKFSSWLYSIASHVLIDEIRKKSKLDTALKDFKLSLTSETYEGDSILDETLNNVQGLTKELIELRYLKDMSFKEISELKELSESNVRKIISRGLIKLKKIKKL